MRRREMGKREMVVSTRERVERDCPLRLTVKDTGEQKLNGGSLKTLEKPAVPRLAFTNTQSHRQSVLPQQGLELVYRPMERV
jgi:hypothetical protein